MAQCGIYSSTTVYCHSAVNLQYIIGFYVVDLRIDHVIMSLQTGFHCFVLHFLFCGLSLCYFVCGVFSFLLLWYLYFLLRMHAKHSNQTSQYETEIAFWRY